LFHAAGRRRCVIIPLTMGQTTSWSDSHRYGVSPEMPDLAITAWGATTPINYRNEDSWARREGDPPQVKGMAPRVIYDGVSGKDFLLQKTRSMPAGAIWLHVNFGWAFSGPVAPIDPNDLYVASPPLFTSRGLTQYLEKRADRASQTSQDLFDVIAKGAAKTGARHALPCSPPPKAGRSAPATGIPVRSPSAPLSSVPRRKLCGWPRTGPVLRISTAVAHDVVGNVFLKFVGFVRAPGQWRAVGNIS